LVSLAGARVSLWADRETVHNAFFDRGYKP
jgi:hypothetical protein